MEPGFPVFEGFALPTFSLVGFLLAPAMTTEEEQFHESRFP
jgi:hypothetical protein